MLTALDNGRPDRLPCQVHGWMQYYLDRYLGGVDWYEANERFGLDQAIYVSPGYSHDESDLANWQPEHKDLGVDADGVRRWEATITTPKGTLHHAGAANPITGWTTEHLIKDEVDFDVWNDFYPVPTGVSFDGIQQARDRLGDRGIVRSHPFSPGQGSPWQSFCTLVGTEEAIFMAMDTPDFLHHALEQIVQKTIRVTELW